MTVLKRLLGRFRRPDHIGWGGDPINPWMPCWTPDPREIR